MSASNELCRREGNSLGPAVSVSLCIAEQIDLPRNPVVCRPENCRILRIHLAINYGGICALQNSNPRELFIVKLMRLETVFRFFA